MNYFFKYFVFTDFLRKSLELLKFWVIISWRKLKLVFKKNKNLKEIDLYFSNKYVFDKSIFTLSYNFQNAIYYEVVNIHKSVNAEIIEIINSNLKEIILIIHGSKEKKTLAFEVNVEEEISSEKFNVEFKNSFKNLQLQMKKNQETPKIEMEFKPIFFDKKQPQLNLKTIKFNPKEFNKTDFI